MGGLYVGLDRFRLRGLGQREAAQEGAGEAFEALEALRVLLALDAALAADRQHAVLGRDFDVLGIDARQIGTDDETLRFLVHVDGRHPGDVARARSFGRAERIAKAFKTQLAVHYLWASCDEAVKRASQHLALRQFGAAAASEKFQRARHSQSSRKSLKKKGKNGTCCGRPSS